jgi:hypothetical protein
LKFTQKDAFLNFKKFYTSISRSLKGTLFYDPNSIISNLYNIVSIEKPSEPYVVFDTNAIKELREKTIKRFE